MKNNFENTLLQKINKKLANDNIKAIAYRLKQSKYCSQVCDLLVDSPLPAYYLAIECKSRIKGNTLSFKNDFSESKKGSQLERLDHFCTLSGRTGLLFFKSGRNTKVTFLEKVLEIKKSGKKSISLTKDDIWVNLKVYFENLKRL